MFQGVGDRVARLTPALVRTTQVRRNITITHKSQTTAENNDQAQKKNSQFQFVRRNYSGREIRSNELRVWLNDGSNGKRVV